MKSILVMNNVLKNSFIEENDFSNDISFTTIENLPKTNNSSISRTFRLRHRLTRSGNRT